jgi:hypothetical protein
MRQHKLQKLLLPLSIALALSGCGEDFKDCDGFWDKTIGRDSCSATEVIDKTLSPDVKKAFGADPNKNDTDGDGLSDNFEITKGFPYLKPDNKDTDNNGIDDAKDDSDKDGLTNLEEMQANTSPINPDTDGDGLSDKAELQTYKTNPLVADTDKDTIIDGREIANGSNPLVADADKFVTSSDVHTLFNEDGTTQKLTVTIAGKGDLASKVEVTGWSDFKTPFQVGRSYDIGLDDADKVNMQDATITLPYDPNDPAASNPNDLKIYTINPATRFYEELPTTIDTVNNTLTAKTTHFSPFFIGGSISYSSYVQSIPQTCPLIGDPNAIPVDVALVIDSSGSMIDNDPQNLRITAAKSFITNMKASDRAAIVDFDSGVTVRQNLTADKTALSSALNQIDSNGGTDIGAGVGSAYSILTNQSDSTRTRVVILLTDGQGQYDKVLSNQLKSQNIRVFTIGLTGQVDEALLKEISSATNGGYKQINDASGLVGVFGQFATVFGDTGKDTDQDGLTDCQEIQGISLPAPLIFGGQVLLTDPFNPDTDNDGLDDGIELGSVSSTTLADGRKIFVASGSSNPINSDTDHDGINDGDEEEFGSNPLSKDTDLDGLSDYKELEIGTLPFEQDTDGDGATDFEESKLTYASPVFYDRYRVSDLQQIYINGIILSEKTLGRRSNSTPPILTAAPSIPQAVKDIPEDIITGMACGSTDLLCPNGLDTVPKFMAALAVEIHPLSGFPAAGRNATAYLWHGEVWNATQEALGVVPVFGDLPLAKKAIAKFIARFPEQAEYLKFALDIAASKAKTDITRKFYQDLSNEAKVVKTKLWDATKTDPKDRGRILERLRADALDPTCNKLFGNFPVIDAFCKGKAISYKSLDLDAKSYTTVSAFKSRIRYYAKSLRNPKKPLQGQDETTGTGITIPLGDITSKELGIDFPRELSLEQSRAIDALRQEFPDINITTKIVKDVVLP